MLTDSEPVPEPAPTPPAPSPSWTAAGRFAFRFAFVYLVLYILPFPLDTLNNLVRTIPDILTEAVTGRDPDPPTGPSLVVKYVTGPYRDAWDRIVLETGKHVFGIEIQYRPAGSGDTTWNYVQVFDFANIALAVAGLWTIAAWGWSQFRGRRREGYPVLHELLRVYVRFYLAEKMALYGAVKVIKLQFGYPGPSALLHTYGESSPMHLLWTFMGASDAYTWFTGAAELLAGVLLCTRRTTLLGALVSFGVMVHVAALNYCYDVPVKLLSTHLVLTAAFLMVPDLPWLTRVFLLGQRATPRGVAPLARRRWLDRTAFGLRTLVVLTYLAVTFHTNLERSKLTGLAAPEPPLYGLWEVEEFSLNGEVRPPLTTDGDRWQRLAVNKAFTMDKRRPGLPRVQVTNMQGKSVLFAEMTVDEEAKTITLTPPTNPFGPPPTEKPPPGQVLKYTEPEPGVIEVEGRVTYGATGPNAPNAKAGPRAVKARLRLYGPDKFLLSSRGFHWINEMPYNQYGPRFDPPPKIMPPPKRP